MKRKQIIEKISYTRKMGGKQTKRIIKKRNNIWVSKITKNINLSKQFAISGKERKKLKHNNFRPHYWRFTRNHYPTKHKHLNGATRKKLQRLKCEFKEIKNYMRPITFTTDDKINNVSANFIWNLFLGENKRYLQPQLEHKINENRQKYWDSFLDFTMKLPKMSADRKVLLMYRLT